MILGNNTFLIIVIADTLECAIYDSRHKQYINIYKVGTNCYYKFFSLNLYFLLNTLNIHIALSFVVCTFSH